MIENQGSSRKLFLGKASNLETNMLKTITKKRLIHLQSGCRVNRFSVIEQLSHWSMVKLFETNSFIIKQFRTQKSLWIIHWAGQIWDYEGPAEKFPICAVINTCHYLCIWTVDIRTKCAHMHAYIHNMSKCNIHTVQNFVEPYTVCKHAQKQRWASLLSWVSGC